MKRTIVSALLFLFAFGAGKAVHAQGTEWDTLNEEISSLYKQGRYDRPMVGAKKALALAEEGVGRENPDVATSLKNLALLYMTQGQYAQAEPLYTRSLAIREKVFGPNHPDVAQSLENMAALFRKTGREKAEEALQQRAAAILAITR